MQLRLATLGLVLLGGVYGCDAMFVEPAARTSLALRVTRSVLMQPDTFKQSDNGTVRVLVSGDTVKKDFEFAPGSNEVRVQIELPLRSSEAQAVVEIELRRGPDPLFSGRQTVNVKQGAVQPVTVPVDVVDYCITAKPYTFQGTVSGSLVADRDCQFQVSRRLRQNWDLILPAPTLFEVQMTSTVFGPFIGMFLPNGPQLTGRSRASTGTVVDEVLLPAGRYWIAATHALSGQAVEGAYTLTTVPIAEPQAGKTLNTGVTFGSSAPGRITSADRRDEIGDPNVDLRYDGYTIALQAGEIVSATVRPDFPITVTRWGSNLEEGIFNIPAGQSRTITFTQRPNASIFQSFYVIAAQHQGTGSYTISFARGTPGTSASIVLKSLTTTAGVPVNTNDVRGDVVATYTATVPPGLGFTQFNVLLNLNFACNAPIGAQTGTFDVQCTIRTTQFPNGSYPLDGRLNTNNNSFVSSGFTTIRINN